MTGLTAAGLEFTRDGELARLTFTRPDKKNAISYEMWSAIPSIVAEVEADTSMTALLLSGQGADFSAGADIGEFRTLRATPDGATAYDKAVDGAVRAITALRKPSIAMIAGNCIGGGCQLAVACDFRLAADNARFGITPAKLGIVYDYVSTRQLVSLIGPAHARYFLLAGQLIDATRAREIGLVGETYPVADLPEAALEFVRVLGSRSQFSVRGINRVIEKVLSGQQDTDEEIERIRAEAIHGADYAEGVSAFLERRKPNFTYR
ncbi:enoyl-CoA hydratase/isomerase family protein [Tamaricihabitans halophyticus]|nr:enoyl-CoA hydratase-related protein [Tamaricihabitans halophyticus]